MTRRLMTPEERKNDRKKMADSLNREFQSEYQKKKSKDSKYQRTPSFFEVASDRELRDLNTFFLSYGANSSVIMMHKVPCKDGKHSKVKNYFIPILNDESDPVVIDLMKNMVLQRSTYISVCPRWCTSKSYARRCLQNIRLFDRIVVDVDPIDHTVPFSEYDILSIRDALQCFPVAPFAIVFTGRGVQIHFLLQPEMAVYHYKWPYNKLVGIFCDEVRKLLDDFGILHGGIDKLTINSVCRLPGTYNTKAKDYARVAYIDSTRLIPENRVPITYLMQMYGIEDRPYRSKNDKRKARRANKKKYHKKKCKRTSTNNLPARMDALYTAIAKDLITPGYRNNALYAYAYSLFCCLGPDSEAVEDKVEALNDMLIEHLPNSEVRDILLSASRQAETKEYPYGLISQLKWIGIDINNVDKSLLETRTEEEKREAHRIAAKRYADKLKAKRARAKTKLMKKTYNAFVKAGTILGTSRILGMSRNTARKYIKFWTMVIKNNQLKNAVKFLSSIMCSKVVDYITGGGPSGYGDAEEFPNMRLYTVPQVRS